MQQVIGQLERLRTTARWLLVTRVAMQGLALVLGLAVWAGLVDYLLRLPGWIRLLVGLSVAAAVAVWLVRRLRLALRFDPDLSTLALRAERLYPELAGKLASGVEFAAHPQDYANPATTAALAQQTVQHVQAALRNRPLSRLLQPRQTLRWAAVGVAALLVTGAIVALAPQSSALAAQRWLLPLGATQWPKRVAIESLVDAAVWPSDTPVRLTAKIRRGHHRGLRTWVAYRRIDQRGQETPWQTQLMNQQTQTDDAHGGRVFERLLEQAATASGTPASRTAAPPASAVEFFFEAGDDRTPVQRLELLPRPEVRAVEIHVSPPPYARGLVQEVSQRLEDQSGPVASASALAGSRVRLRFELTKLVETGPDRWAQIFPGWADVPEAAFSIQPADGSDPSNSPSILAEFVLRQTVQTPVRLIDRHGLTNVSERLYRLTAVEDKPPVVTLTEPPGDQTVLPTARIDLEAIARDDVGMADLWIESQTPLRQSSASEATTATTPVARATQRQAQVRLTHQLDLGPLNLKPGDEVVLTAVGQDVYEFDSSRHEPVRSAPRRLRVADVATVVGQIHSELAALRQQALRLAGRQQELLEASPQASTGPQREVSRSLEAQSALVKTLQQRMARNRLEEPALTQILEQADRLLAQAQDASRQAQTHLDAAKENPDENLPPARRQQQNVGQALSDLVSLLDQGRDAVALQLQLRQLETIQQAVASDTRQLLPRTLGQDPEKLDPEHKRQLEELANRQGALAQQAQSLAQQMQSAAEGLTKQSQNAQEQAAAQALAQAAAIAQRQGLAQSMRQAAQAAARNQLSSAGQQQQQSLDTLRQMLKQLQDQQEQRQAILKRRLMDLAQAIAKLIEQQKAQIERLGQAQTLAGLEPPLSTLRTNTLAVQQQAAGQKETAVAAPHLGEAATQQGTAVTALRQEQRDPAAAAQQQALVKLHDAQKAIAELQQKADQEEAQQKRKQLQQAYEELAKTQETLRQDTQKAAAEKEVTRRQRAQLVELGHRQADVQVSAAALRPQVDQTLLFKQLHDQIDQTASRAAGQLRQAKADGEVLADQESIVTTLQAMAAALAEAQRRPQDFSGQSGGGGGGGGSGGPMPLVPPIAELRLLRGLQQSVYDHTRRLAQPPADNNAPPGQDQALMRVGAQQRQLAAMGEELVRQLAAQQQQQQGGQGGRKHE